MGHEKHEREEIEEEFEDEQPDPEEDVVGRRCRACRKTFYLKRGKRIRNCPFCGADQSRGGATAPLSEDPRQVRPWWPRRAKGL